MVVEATICIVPACLMYAMDPVNFMNRSSDIKSYGTFNPEVGVLLCILVIASMTKPLPLSLCFLAVHFMSSCDPGIAESGHNRNICTIYHLWFRTPFIPY